MGGNKRAEMPDAGDRAIAATDQLVDAWAATGSGRADRHRQPAASGVLLEVPLESYCAASPTRQRWVGWLTLAVVAALILFWILDELAVGMVLSLPLQFWWLQGPFAAWTTDRGLLVRWHVLLRDAGGSLRLERQVRWRQRVVRRKPLELARYRWLRVGSPDMEPQVSCVELQLGNPAYDTLVLARIRSPFAQMEADEFARAREHLLALGAEVAALASLVDRGYARLY